MSMCNISPTLPCIPYRDEASLGESFEETNLCRNNGTLSATLALLFANHICSTRADTWWLSWLGQVIPPACCIHNACSTLKPSLVVVIHASSLAEWYLVQQVDTCKFVCPAACWRQGPGNGWWNRTQTDKRTRRSRGYRCYCWKYQYCIILDTYAGLHCIWCWPVQRCHRQ
jgi:hypothetical protein